MGALGDTLRRFVRAHPDTEMAMHDDRPGETARACAAAISTPCSAAAQLTTWTSYTTTHWAGCLRSPQAHRLAALEPVRWRSSPRGPGLRRRLPSGRRRIGPFERRAWWSRPSIATASNGCSELVSAPGPGRVCAPPSRRACRRGLVSRPIDGMALVHEVNLATKRGRVISPPVKAYRQYCSRGRAARRWQRRPGAICDGGDDDLRLGLRPVRSPNCSGRTIRVVRRWPGSAAPTPAAGSRPAMSARTGHQPGIDVGCRPRSCKARAADLA